MVTVKDACEPIFCEKCGNRLRGGFEMGKLEIVKVKDYDNEGGMVGSKIEADLAKRGLLAPTPEWWFNLSADEAKEYHAYTPIYLGKTAGGLLLRGDYYYGDYGRLVVAGVQPSLRYGVVGVKPSTNSKKQK